MVAGGSLTMLFFIMAGVLQGCPLSGFLFALALDPFLTWMVIVVEIPDLGRIRVCADDVGSSLRKLSVLLALRPVFAAIRAAAGPSLKPRKCVIVPTDSPFSAELASRIKAWLKESIPQWADFRIEPSARYLGFYLGPQSADKQWDAPLDKFSSRALLAADAHTATSISSFRFNARAAPVLGYLAQLVPLPRSFRALEKRLLYKLLHMPYKALGYDMLFRLREVDSSKLVSCAAMAFASRLRFALSTVETWPALLRMLRESAEEHLPMARAFAGFQRDFLDRPRLWAPLGVLHWPEFWDSKPLAFHLGEAADLFASQPVLHVALTRLLRRPRAPLYPDGPPS